MKYPINYKNIIDVTKPPYNADSSGRYDCTAALCKALDDVLRREAEGVNETAEKLLNAGGDMYIGFETRIVNLHFETREKVGNDYQINKYTMPYRVYYSSPNTVNGFEVTFKF